MAAAMPSPLGTERVLTARGVSKIYRMGEVEVRALDGVDFDLFRGELLVLLGPSGSGKSTLLNILGGLDVPSGGELAFFDGGRERPPNPRGARRGDPALAVASLPELPQRAPLRLDLGHADARALTRFRREHVGFVFQFYNLIPSLTARENVSLVTEIAAHPMRAEEALGMVGLADRMDHFPAQMSGGEQQRVAIARAIAKRPDVLLCDEPTGALDVSTGKLVLAALAEVNRALGTSTAIITHNAAIAAMADRVVTMAGGRISSVRVNAERVGPDALSW